MPAEQSQISIPSKAPKAQGSPQEPPTSVQSPAENWHFGVDRKAPEVAEVETTLSPSTKEQNSPGPPSGTSMSAKPLACLCSH